MTGRDWRKIILALNFFLIVGMYSFLVITFLGKKEPPVWLKNVELIDQEDFKTTKKSSEKHRGPKLDEYLTIGNVFQGPKKPRTPVKRQPTQKRKQPVRRGRLNLMWIAYDSSQPDRSRIAVMSRGQTQIVPVGAKIQGKTFSAIKRKKKGSNKGRVEVMYEIFLTTPQGQKERIPFSTQEVGD